MIKKQDKLPSYIVDEIIRFSCSVREELGESLSRIYLFGSYNSGSYHTWSDIDLAIVANWKSQSLTSRIALLMEISIKEECYRIQPIGVTEKELEKNKNHKFFSTIEKGVLVFLQN